MNVLEYFQKITTFVFDVDGVLTDGSVLLLENGLQARQMNIKDGLALQMAVKNGYRVVIVSGAASGPVIDRFRYLGIEEKSDALCPGDMVEMIVKSITTDAKSPQIQRHSERASLRR